MSIRCVKLSPTENMTLLVETAVPREKHQPVADRLMALDPEIEQVGFLEPPPQGCDVRLQMSGGEFCGNATLSAAALFLHRTGRTSATVKVSVSGAPDPVSVALSGNGDTFYGTVEMPLPEKISMHTFPLDSGTITLPVVHFPGVDHVIVTEGLSRSQAEQVIRSWCAQLKVQAIGLLLIEETQLRLSPLVYVAPSRTLFWERSCASGTSAVGAWAAMRAQRSVELALQEPGGVMRVCAEWSAGGVCRLCISGGVQILAERTLCEDAACSADD